MNDRDQNWWVLALFFVAIIGIALGPVFPSDVCIATDPGRESIGVCFRNWLQSTGPLLIAAIAAYIAHYWANKQYVISVRPLQEKILTEISEERRVISNLAYLLKCVDISNIEVGDREYIDIPQYFSSLFDEIFENIRNSAKLMSDQGVLGRGEELLAARRKAKARVTSFRMVLDAVSRSLRTMPDEQRIEAITDFLNDNEELIDRIIESIDAYSVALDDKIRTLYLQIVQEEP